MDQVNNPAHYHANGIEVIDVIEAYAKTDFRLANVLKYVCRWGYKGKKLEDLRKAAWYLQRVIEELTLEERDQQRKAWPSRREAPNFQSVDGDIWIENGPKRIAGETEAAAKIKNKYYGFDAGALRGACHWDDLAIGAADTFAMSDKFPEKIFCSTDCIDKMIAWESEWGGRK